MHKSIWWKKINNASRFIHDITAPLLAKQSVIIYNNEIIPFYDEFKERIIDKLSRKDSSNSLKNINLSDFEDINDVADFLLKQYCSKDVQDDFFPKKDFSKAEYLSECTSFQLNYSTVWVKNVSGNLANEWINFIKKYEKNSPYYKATFIIEIKDTPSDLNNNTIPNSLYSEDYFNKFDYFVFCFLLVSTFPDISHELKQYMAELVASICRNKIELCAELCEYGIDFIKKPHEILENILGDEYHEMEINSLIWQTQNSVVFPLLESYRRMIVDDYIDAIKSAMPFKATYGIEINEPYELDLGNILSLHTQVKISLEKDIYQDIKKLHDIRCSLAHMKPINYDDMFLCFQAVNNYTEKRFTLKNK